MRVARDVLPEARAERNTDKEVGGKGCPCGDAGVSYKRGLGAIPARASGRGVVLDLLHAT